MPRLREHDGNATDPYGDGCAAYEYNPSWCGGHDDEDFTSYEMCCICGGGTGDPYADSASESVKVDLARLWDSAGADHANQTMRGTPYAGTLSRYEFCAAPGDYLLSAVDAEGDGWWGGARYWLAVNGELVINEEMGLQSPALQTSAFTIALPESMQTRFEGNAAPEGGGGAVFWKDNAPENVESYRKQANNTALYGTFAATPARTLRTVARDTYSAVSGESMSSDPITIELTDRWGRAPDPRLLLQQSAHSLLFIFAAQL